MASNLISRLLPPRTGSPSVYEALREHDQSSEASDVEERAGMMLDEENLGQRFEDLELDQAEVERLSDSHQHRTTAESSALLGENLKQRRNQSWRQQRGTGEALSRPRWMDPSPGSHAAEEGDDEVPQSLLIEGGEGPSATGAVGEHGPGQQADISSVPGPSTPETRVHWETTKRHQTLYTDSPRVDGPKRAGSQVKKGLLLIDPKERAMWRWANVENLDNFLKDVYDYFLGNGIWCILLSRALNLLTLGFVVGFTTFLTMCIDYRKVPQSKTMSQILLPQCIRRMSTSTSFLLWLFTFFWIVKVFQYLLDIRQLRHMHDFYLYLLGISDSDIQTISWQEIVSRLMALRDANPVTADGIGAKQRRFMGSQSKQRMDAHDIANRLMRKENYLIALFNKDILDMTLPIPFLRNRQLFSKTLEWNLSLCVLDFVFNEQGQVRPLFLRDTHRRALSDGLRRRFLFAGFMNVICAPFIVIYLLMLYFFRYFTEYQKNPSQLGSRQYTPLAEWKFREFNELWHLFQRRLNMSYPFASRYVDQFPKDKTVQISRFVGFVAGALTSVLALASVIDPELFLGFEITPERTVLFYLGVFGTVWAVARGVVPEETLVFDPEYALNNVVEYTHYLPGEWRGRLHSNEVKKEFSMLYQMKVVIFIEELLSIVFTPFILWFSLPKCSDRLVDFFREFTVHVDGLGYVCSFAVFDFKKGGSNTVHPRRNGPRAAAQLREDYYSAKDGKMLASYYGFLDNYSKNPRAGGGAPTQPATKRHVYAPPAFPGLATSAFPAAEPSGPIRTQRERPSRTSNGPTTAQADAPPIQVRSNWTAGGTEPVSSVPSLLLDPRHQPSMVGAHRSSRQHGRYRSPNPPLAEEPVEDTEGISSQQTQRSAGATPSGSAGAVGEDSSLGGSWKTTRAGGRDNEEEEEEDDDGEGVGGDHGAGVLGLLYQFQKAQTEGRGPGVTI
ncbi:MAG: autophagy protein atg9 [Peltula sp. TS41687]|nr:MAG: autophagy protein atg9 [Peltula sp. TS41687]